MIQDYFRSFNIFSDHEITDLIQNFTPREIRKSGYFVKEGDRCKEIAFIQTGTFRSYYTSDDGTENTFCFRFPNNLLAPYSAFITGDPSVETMQAITDSKLWVIQKGEVDHLINKNMNWTKLLKLNAEHEYLELEKRFFQLQKDNATERYVSLLQNHPQYVLEIPLQYLASYLGITQRHLSRIRKQFSF
jgi:CRP-like cAMP-binding protein